jgi:phosphate uptake regulator
MKNKKNIRAQKRANRRLEARKNIATWTVTEFTNSFKVIKNNFFHIQTIKPKNDVERVLFVTSDELQTALKAIQYKDFSSENQIIQLDENEINSAYEQILK